MRKEEKEEEQKLETKKGSPKHGKHVILKSIAGIVCGSALTVGIIYGAARAALPGLVPAFSVQTITSTTGAAYSSVSGKIQAMLGKTDAEQTQDPGVTYTQQVIVPDLVGKTEKQALQSAVSSGLGIRFRSETKSNADEGTIVEQDPAAGEIVDVNSTIFYVTSLGAPNVTFPNVDGMQLYEAVQTLENAGFDSIIYDYSYSDATSTGRVISCSHSAGETVSAAAHITLSIGRGFADTSTTVGDYLYRDLDSALASAQDDKLIPIIRYGYSDCVAKGCIMAQSLSSGMKVPYGESIELTVCSGEYESQGDNTIKPFDVTLDQGLSMTGAACRFVYDEEVDGVLIEHTLYDGDGNLEYPLTLTVAGAHSQNGGTIRVYEKVEDSTDAYIPRCSWAIAM